MVPVIYTVLEVDVLACTAFALVAVPAVAAFKFATWVVEVTTNGAVPVASVEIN